MFLVKQEYFNTVKGILKVMQTNDRKHSFTKNNYYIIIVNSVVEVLCIFYIKTFTKKI